MKPVRIPPLRESGASPPRADKPGSGRARWSEGLAVYLRWPMVVVLVLGFSGGLPLALTGATLQVWMTDVKIDLGTIGLFALVGLPYTVKFLWAPLIDAVEVPVLSRLLGRRRGWLMFTQLLLMAAIAALGMADPAASPLLVAVCALVVAAVSATQDIVIDAFRIECFDAEEQGAGIACYVAGYRIGMLASGAAALFLVTAVQRFGLSLHGAWMTSYVTMAALVLLGIAATLMAREPRGSAQVEAARDAVAYRRPQSASGVKHSWAEAGQRVRDTAIRAFVDFVQHRSVRTVLAILAFVVLFKLTDALAGVMTAPFVTGGLGFSRDVYAGIIKVFGLAASLAGGFAGGFVARFLPLSTSLWVGAIVQAAANLAFSWQAVVGADVGWLTFAITLENFTSGIGTVIFVAYLSALCRNPLNTATQYGLLTALSAVGRTFLAAPGGYLAKAVGWPVFFLLCILAAIPGLVLLAVLQRSGHFSGLQQPGDNAARASS